MLGLGLLITCTASQDASAATDRTATWPRFRGPEGCAIAAPGDAYPAAIDAEAPKWRTTLPPGLSSPVVHGDRIFLTGHGEAELLTLCLDRTSGEELWRRSIDVESFERHHEINGPASSTPAVDASRVVVHFGSYGLVAYDHEGALAWERPMERVRNSFGSAASPILEAGRVVFVHDSNDGSNLESIDAATGETVWRVDRSEFKSGWSTPTVVRQGDRTELLVYGVWWLVAYDLANGAELWRAPGLTDEPITSPLVAEDLVIVTSYNMKTNPEVESLPTFAELLAEHDADGSGTLDAEEIADNVSVLSRHDADGEGDHPLEIFRRWMDADRDGEVTAPEWQKVVDWVDGFAHANGVLALRRPMLRRPKLSRPKLSRPKLGRPATPDGDESEATPQAEVVWSHAQGVPECPSPLAIDGRIYFVKNGGMATCLDAETGALVWRGRTGARGPAYASPVSADGRIYACSARGELVVFEAADELRVVSTTDFGERIMATPALAGGEVYVRTAEALYAFAAAR